MHVIFVEPGFPYNQREFVRGLHEAGAAVTGIGEAPLEALDHDLRSWMVGYEHVSSVCNERALYDAVRRVQSRGWVDRMESTVEAHTMFAAKVRESCGIPGTTVQTSFLCRDKPAMKEALRQADIPCAMSTGANSPSEVRDFIDEVGYPVIIKPRDGAGAAGTFRVDDDAGLQQALADSGVDRGASVAVEEFIEGHEGFYDTISVDGKVVHEFISHYYPNVLQAMRTRWISPQIVATNRIDAGSYDEVKLMGRKVIEALGIGTSATHMEWFFGPKGLKFSEIGCRPPGVGAWDLYCASNELDLYSEWGHAIANGCGNGKPTRRYAAGHVTLRPEGDGVISGYTGVDELRADWGAHITDSHFPPPGSPTQPVEAGYMANAWVRLRHADYDTLVSMLDKVGENVKVHVR